MFIKITKNQIEENRRALFLHITSQRHSFICVILQLEQPYTTILYYCLKDVKNNRAIFFIFLYWIRTYTKIFILSRKSGFSSLTFPFLSLNKGRLCSSVRRSFIMYTLYRTIKCHTKVTFKMTKVMHDEKKGLQCLWITCSKGIPCYWIR